MTREQHAIVSPDMPTGVVIETANASDHAAIAMLNMLAYAEFEPAMSADAWEAMQPNLTNIAVRAQHGQFVVARASSGIVGSASYCPPGILDTTYFSPDMSTVFLLAVHPDHRGQGIARQLLLACSALARRDGAASLALLTSDLMQPAQALYRSMGFHMDAELPMRLGSRNFRFVLPLERP